MTADEPVIVDHTDDTLSPADAWWNGWADGSRDQPPNPPTACGPALCELYGDGYAAGAKERTQAGERFPAPVTDDEIPW